MARSFAEIWPSSPVTISEPQCVMMARGTPSFSHHVNWVRTGECPMSALPRLRMNECVTVAPSPKVPEPIEATIDHHIRGAIRDHQRSMHTMASRPLLDFTARAKERQLHPESLVFFSGRRATYLVTWHCSIKF